MADLLYTTPYPDINTALAHTIDGLHVTAAEAAAPDRETTGIDGGGILEHHSVGGISGDTGQIGLGQRKIAQQLKAYRDKESKIDFAIMLGDNVYPDGVGRGLKA